MIYDVYEKKVIVTYFYAGPHYKTGGIFSQVSWSPTQYQTRDLGRIKLSLYT
jgi:hypothetical protein